jgi:Ca-activated chloride channel family protein
VSKWPDDLDLALRLLDAFEDAGDDAGGRALARTLRRRSDATTNVRTSVGEYYLRLAARGKGPPAERDRVEAHRTFGEIVEFAPDDPFARRVLGDLLRAHGWYEEALRQYETLAALVPDDARVPLLRALTAQGTGRTEEAVRWTEKASELGSPDPSSPLSETSRSLASAFLAWSRSDALEKTQKDDAARLLERSRRLVTLEPPGASGPRVLLTWSHPLLRPELWSGSSDAMSPATRGDPAVGISEARVFGNQELEVRLAPSDAVRAARVGAEAQLTVISDEGTDQEKIDLVTVKFRADDGAPLERRSFRVHDGKVVWKEDES